MLSSLSMSQKSHLTLLIYILVFIFINTVFYLSEIIITTSFQLPFDINQSILLEEAINHPRLNLIKILFWIGIDVFLIYMIVNLIKKIYLEENLKKYKEEINKLKGEIREYERTVARDKIIITDEDVLRSKEEYKSIHKIFSNAFETTISPLDYVAFFKQDANGKITFIEHSSKNFNQKLKESEIDKTAEQQIQRYREVAASLQETIDILNNKFSVLKQHMLIRSVFDVKKGGVFYYHFSDDEFLFGATVDQSKMNDDTADIQMRLFYEEIFVLIRKDPFHEY